MNQKRPALLSAVYITALTIMVLLVHGFHPAAEDGGIYAAGIYLRLDPSLFPHDAEFVRAPMAYSGFARLLAGVCNLLHTTPLWVLFGAHLATIALTLAAAHRICRVCNLDGDESLGAIALLGVWWTLPVAGTSLSLGDPYVTARSFSLPLSLFAISFALERWTSANGCKLWTRILLCLGSLALTAFMHELMFGFAAAFVFMLRARMGRRWKLFLGALGAGAIVCCLISSLEASAESSAFVRAELTRNYWFLAQWHWYEVSGLVAPLVVLGFCAWRSGESKQRTLCSTGLATGVLCTVIAVLFARQNARSHLIARLQPLRMFTVLYVLMTLVLGTCAVRLLTKASGRFAPRLRLPLRTASFVLIYGGLAAVMFSVQRENFSSSNHLEVPWGNRQEINPWVEAFSWCREHTASDSLFALDAAYIHAPQNDAQTFRAHALRSVLSDQSKDGGEAAVESRLAEAWLRGFDAQTNLNQQSDEQRQTRLLALGANYVLLGTHTKTALNCTYANALVKVCRVSAKP